MKEKTEAEWQKILTPEQYSICRCSETEPPFNNEYWDCHEEGKYCCVCCDSELLVQSISLIQELGGLAFMIR